MAITFNRVNNALRSLLCTKGAGQIEIHDMHLLNSDTLNEVYRAKDVMRYFPKGLKCDIYSGAKTEIINGEIFEVPDESKIIVAVSKRFSPQKSASKEISADTRALDKRETFDYRVYDDGYGDGVQKTKIYRARYFEDTFLRHLYRTIEELAAVLNLK